jgi:hypothetical protein
VRNREENGHSFSLDRDVCKKCGISWNAYADNGRPKCPGEKPDLPKPVPFEED